MIRIPTSAAAFRCLSPVKVLMASTTYAVASNRRSRWSRSHDLDPLRFDLPPATWLPPEERPVEELEHAVGTHSTLRD
jgi:hypothetical protein